MDANWRPTQGAESAMDTSDWRAQLQPDYRQRTVNKIMDTLKRHLPLSSQDGLHELRKIAQRFEEKICASATSQSDYLRKISLKMLTMENKTQNTMVNAMQSNAGGPCNESIDSVNSIAMDANWRPTQGAESTRDTSDWRTQLQPASRQRIVNKIMDTLKRHLPVSGQDGLHELRRIAQRFEEKIYAAATSQSDYLRKISLKMLTMENKTRNTMVNAMQSNAGGPSNKPIDSGIPMQSQVHNPGQSHAIPVPNQSQSGQQLLSQNIQNNIAPPVSNIGQTPIQNVVGPNSNVQNNMFGGSQRQMPPRQQVVPQQQQQSQNSQPYLYQQQQLLLQHLKHKIQPGNIQHLLMQPHIQMQQQHQPNHLQSSQSSVMQTSSVMQPSITQTSLPSLLQNQQANNVQQSTQPMLQEHPQSVIRQQQQQSSIDKQQQTPISQQSIMPPQQPQLLAPQSNVTSMQQMFQNQHSSPQVGSQNLPLLSKVSASMQSANPPYVGTTPSPPLAPSPMPGDSKKPISVVSSVSNAANIGHRQKVIETVPAKSLAMVTPGIISPSSPLLAKFSGPNGSHGNALAISSAKLTIALLFFFVLWLVFYRC